jgi:hypothetical protein
MAARKFCCYKLPLQLLYKANDITLFKIKSVFYIDIPLKQQKKTKFDALKTAKKT